MGRERSWGGIQEDLEGHQRDLGGIWGDLGGTRGIGGVGGGGIQAGNLKRSRRETGDPGDLKGIQEIWRDPGDQGVIKGALSGGAEVFRRDKGGLGVGLGWVEGKSGIWGRMRGAWEDLGGI